MERQGIKVGISSGNHGTVVKWLDITWGTVDSGKVFNDRMVRIKSDDGRHEVVIFKSHITAKKKMGRFYVVLFDLARGYSQHNLVAPSGMKDMFSKDVYLKILDLL